MLAFFHKKFKLLGPVALVILSSLITACGGVALLLYQTIVMLTMGHYPSQHLPIQIY